MRTREVELCFLDEGPSPKAYPVKQDDFLHKLQDFPQELAERLVELGYAKWIQVDVKGIPTVPIGVTFPEQFLVLHLRTHAVKIVHVCDLVGELERKGIPHYPEKAPDNYQGYANLLIANASYEHDPKDYEEPVFDEEDELYDNLVPLEGESFEEEEVEDKEEVKDTKPAPKKPAKKK